MSKLTEQEIAQFSITLGVWTYLTCIKKIDECKKENSILTDLDISLIKDYARIACTGVMLSVYRELTSLNLSNQSKPNHHSSSIINTNQKK